MDVIGLHFKVQVSLVQYLSNGTTETKLVILTFLYCVEFGKNTIRPKENNVGFKWYINGHEREIQKYDAVW